MKRIILSLTFALAFVLDTLASGMPKFTKAIEALQKDGQNSCTISSFNKKAHFWITAAHCVEVWDDEGPTDVQDDAGHSINNSYAMVLKRSFAKDLAILFTPDLVPNSQLEFSKTAPDYDTELVTAGHPYGYDSLFIVYGRVSNPDAVIDGRHFTLTTLPVAGGDSGSPIMKLNGELVGIMQYGWGQGFSPVSGGASWSDLKTFISPLLP